MARRATRRHRLRSAATRSPRVLTDLFARGDFEALSDDQKLSGPAFAAMESGFRLEPPAAAAVTGLTTDAAYETVVLGAA